KRVQGSTDAAAVAVGLEDGQRGLRGLLRRSRVALLPGEGGGRLHPPRAGELGGVIAPGKRTREPSAALAPRSARTPVQEQRRRQAKFELAVPATACPREGGAYVLMLLFLDAEAADESPGQASLKALFGPAEEVAGVMSAYLLLVSRFAEAFRCVFPN